MLGMTPDKWYMRMLCMIYINLYAKFSSSNFKNSKVISAHTDTDRDKRTEWHTDLA